jgi:hypothetical protein
MTATTVNHWDEFLHLQLGPRSGAGVNWGE